MSIRPDGSVRSIDRGGMHIEHGVRGGRTVVSEHNGAIILTTGRGGYVQRAYAMRGGHAYYSRTFYDHGHYRVRVYRGYYYGGHLYYSYYPSYWYHPAFYAWASSAWPAAVYWSVGAWGWGGAPWWGFYGGWFNPYPAYAAPYFWLTDDLLASNLKAEYTARAEANADATSADAHVSGGGAVAAPASNTATLTPEVKRAIAEEVKTQLAAQQAAGQGSVGRVAAPASGEVPPALDPAHRTHLVDSDVNVVANGQECALTAGDVIVRLTDTPDADQTVKASVAASKKSDCETGRTVAVKVDDLQEMYNHFQEQLANGLAELAKKQGTGGMPKAPDAGPVPSDVPLPEPDVTAAKALQEQQEAADRIEAEVRGELTPGAPGNKR